MSFVHEENKMLSDIERKESQRLRTAKSRQKRKEQAVIAAAADEERRFEEFNEYRRTERLVMPGELEAFQDAASCPDALTVAREFLAALNLPDVQPGETLLDVERRAMAGFCAPGGGLLNRNTLRIETSTASTTDGFTYDFDTRWIQLPGSDQLIDVATLPVIEIPAVCEVPAVDTPAITDHTNDPAFRNHRSEEVIAICKAQQERCDTEARKISAANLEREIEKEKRVGVGYAYAE
jgi:hypothetical protein